jgi:AcrR family transcriptional regulator
MTRRRSSSSSSRPGRAASRRDGERSREGILDAAELLFAERGFAGTGISAISRESGLPASSIYWFFEDKQDLAAAVVERAADRWLDELEEPADALAPPPQRFGRLMTRAQVRMGPEMPLFSRLYMLLALETGELAPALRTRLRRCRERGRRVLSEALVGLVAELTEEKPEPLAEELSHPAMAFIEGALLQRELDPKVLDLELLTAELEVALRAIARHRLGDASA